MTGETPSNDDLYTLEEADEAVRRMRHGAGTKLTVEDVILLLLYADPRPIKGQANPAGMVLHATTNVLSDLGVEHAVFHGGRSGPHSDHIDGAVEQLSFSNKVRVSGGGADREGFEIEITPLGRDAIRERYESLPPDTRAALSRKRSELDASAPPGTGDATTIRGEVSPEEAAPEGGEGGGWDVFISYAHVDGEHVAAQLEQGLVRRGLRVWRDETGLTIGDKMSREIVNAIKASTCIVTVVSTAYAERPWTMIELGAALSGNEATLILPVLHEVSHSDAVGSLPFLADTVMRPWNAGDEDVMDEIASVVERAKKHDPHMSTASACLDPGPIDRDLLAEASKGAAMGIPDALDEIPIDRSAQVGEISNLLEGEGRVAVVGDRGSGKSGLAWMLYKKLAESGTALLVRCDDFLGIESAEQLDRSIIQGRSLAAIARRASAAGGIAVIFDSLDAAARNEKTMRAFRRLIATVWGAGARTVVTVRSYDYKYSHLVGATDWGKKYDLQLLSDEEVGRALEGIGSPPVPPRLRALLAIPLNLRLLSLILKKSPGADLAPINYEIDLYDAHWHHCVETEQLSVGIKDVLYDAAEGMFRARATLIPYVPGPDGRRQAAAGLALSSNILIRTGDGGMIRYFHHAYMDYVMSRALLERHQPVARYLRGDDYNVFMLPTLPFALAIARRRDAATFALTVEGILRADVRHYWKSAAVSALAAAAAASAETGDGGGSAHGRLEELLGSQPALQRHFLKHLAEQDAASWFPEWGNAILGWAFDPENCNGAFIIGCIRAASADAGCHAGAFAVAKALAGNSREGWVREGAIAAMAKIDAGGKAEWLEVASTSADARVRDGVAHNLPGLLKSDPCRIPFIFCNLYSHEETSGKKTEITRIGTFRMTSNMAQDNYMSRFKLDQALPQLLESNPLAMLRAVVLTVERMCGDSGGNGAAQGTPGAAPGRLRGPVLSPFSPVKGDILVRTREYLAGCSDDDFSRLVPVLEGAEAAPLRAMLMDGMAARLPPFLDKIKAVLCDPRTYESVALRQSALGAIKAASGLLDAGSAGQVAGAIMASNTPRDRTEGELRRCGTAQSAFLSALPRDALSAEHLSIIDRFPAGDAWKAPPDLDVKFEDMPDKDGAEQDPLDAAKAAIGGGAGGLDTDQKIAALESIRNVLGGRSVGDLGGDLLRAMEEFLLACMSDADPEEDSAKGPASPYALAGVPSVRGLAAECLIRMLPLREGQAITDAIRALSRDPVNMVRADVARSLPGAPTGRYDLLRDVALPYSRDEDPIVRFFVPGIVDRILQRDPELASAMIENVLDAGGPAPHGTAGLLLWLAIGLREPRAAGLLERATKKGAFDEDMRAALPFALKEGYLARDGHRNAALDALYGLLGDPSRAVREKAVFFTLNGFDDDPRIDNRAYVGRIAPHLARMASMLGAEPFDLAVAETTARFFEKFCRYAPGAALDCLEAIVGGGGMAAASEASVAEPCINVLAVLLQLHSLSGPEWRRCMDVLDAYAAVGWPGALDLLDGMGRRD